tara:strand:+ start:4156 stop:4821 length:666 start_codon:yes stop_codon:yes gene_type:complete
MHIFTISLTSILLLTVVSCSNEINDDKNQIKETVPLGNEITLEGQLPSSLTDGLSKEEKSKLESEILPSGSTDNQDLEKKFLKLKQDAQNGDAKAQTTLGVMYFTGQAISKDESGKVLSTDAAKAAAWFHRAALQGHADAQFNLGLMYATGQGGLTKDAAKAVDFFRKAALQGNADAQNNLGAMYHLGEGIKKDNTKAREWYKKSAAQGNADAQANLKTLE